MVQTTEVKAKVHQMQPITGEAAIAKPKVTYDLDNKRGGDNEVHRYTSITLTFVDMPDSALRRLARAAGEDVQVHVEILPQLEQMEFEE